MTTETYDPPDLEEDGWTSVPDEAVRFENSRPAPATDPSAMTDDEFDDWVDDNRSARRKRVRQEQEKGNAGVGVRAATVIVVGAGASAVVWVFAGPLIAASVAGAGVVVWVGRKMAAIGREARKSGRARGGAAQGRSLRRANGQPGPLGRMLGRGGKGALAGRNRLLGAGAGGGRAARKGLSGLGGGPKAGRKGLAGLAGLGGGPKAGRKPGGKNPLSGLAGKLGRRRAAAGAGAGAANAARSGGLTTRKPRGGGGGPRSLRNLLPKASATRAQAKTARAQAKAAKRASKTTSPYVPGRMSSLMPTRRGAAARHARAVARAQRIGKAGAGGYVPSRLAAMMPTGRGRSARAARAHARAQGTLPKSRAARWARNATVTPLVFLGKYGIWVPAKWAVKWGLWKPGKAVAYYAVWKPTQFLVVKPAVWVARWADHNLLTRPNEFLMWYAQSKWANHKLYSRGRRMFGRANSRFRLVNRFMPQWWLDARLLSGLKGRWAAMLGLLMAAWTAVVTFFTWFVNGNDSGRHSSTGRHPLDIEATTASHAHARPPGVDPIAPLAQAMTAPAPTIPPLPAPQPAAAGAGSTTAPGSSSAQPTTIGGRNVARATNLAAPTGAHTDLLQIPGGLHHTHTALLQDAVALHGQFSPRSFPDLTIYLASMHDSLKEEQKKWAVLGDYLVSSFPGFNLAQSFAERVDMGYGQLATRAHGIFEGYRALHAADFARFLDPRVNELYADVKQWGETPAAIPILTHGGQMHARHILWLSSCDLNLSGFRPQNTAEDDVWDELRFWLAGLAPAFAARARYAIHFVDYGLQGRFPIEDGVADVTRQIARGYSDLADYGFSLYEGFQNRNPHDRNRRDRPKPNEYLRDVGNAEMSNA